MANDYPTPNLESVLYRYMRAGTKADEIIRAGRRDIAAAVSKAINDERESVERSGADEAIKAVLERKAAT